MLYANAYINVTDVCYIKFTEKPTTHLNKTNIIEIHLKNGFKLFYSFNFTLQIEVFISVCEDINFARLSRLWGITHSTVILH